MGFWINGISWTSGNVPPIPQEILLDTFPSMNISTSIWSHHPFRNIPKNPADLGSAHPFGMTRQTHSFPNSGSSKETQTFPAFAMNVEQLWSSRSRNSCLPKNNGIVFPFRLNGNDSSAGAVKSSWKLGSSGKGFSSCLEGVFRDAAPLSLYLETQARNPGFFLLKKILKSGIWDELSHIPQISK